MSHPTTEHQVDLRCWPSIRKLSPCEYSCPITTDVPTYVALIGQGKFEEAFKVVREGNPLPSICGHICHHPCEEACSRVTLEEPIAIRALKRFITDCALSAGWRRPTPIETDGERRVAIIGSGPAGLSAAHDLIRLQYSVTVYEALPVSGGMLTIGIPEFILPRQILQADIDYIKAMGVEIKENTPLGKNLTLEDLFQQGYKAIFLAFGAQASQKLNILGMDLEGIFYALPLLKAVNLGNGPKLTGKVAIIGGGNAAVDSARVALRLGADEVDIFYRRIRDEMPAFTWDIERAEEEGVRIHCSMAPLEFVGKGGRLSGIKFGRVRSIEYLPGGSVRPVLIEGSEYTLDTDYAVVAIGQEPDLSFLEGCPGLDITAQGSIAVDSATLATNIPGVFAGGDAVKIAGTVVEAIASGRKAAQYIDKYIKGDSLKPLQTETREELIVDEERIPKFLERRARHKMPLLPAKERAGSFQEVELGFTEETAMEEAKRCLSCPICGNCMFFRAQMCYETAKRLL